MTKNQTTALIIIILVISGFLSFVGSIFKLQNWAHGSAFLRTGAVFWFISIGAILFTVLKRRKKHDSV